MSPDFFSGEYWNIDAATKDIVRLRFAHREGRTFVSAWGNCFPVDCEWGETTLHLLPAPDDVGSEHEAFATWQWDVSASHCLLSLSGLELTVVQISIGDGMPAYKSVQRFRQDAARSQEAINPDPLAKFKDFWDATSGYKLVQFAQPVSLVEFHFDDSGPNRTEFAALLEFLGPQPGESEEQMWERLRDCSGIGLSRPIGAREVERLLAHQHRGVLNLSLWTIEQDDYLTLTPDGNYDGWTALIDYRRPVIERMIAAGIPVVTRSVD